MPYFSGLKILIRNDRRMTHPPERDIYICFMVSDAPHGLLMKHRVVQNLICCFSH